MVLDLFQRLSTEKVRGNVERRIYTTTIPDDSPATIYSIHSTLGADVTVGAIVGHPSSPSEGDYVEMLIGRRYCLDCDANPLIRQLNGVVVHSEEKCPVSYRKIVRFKRLI